jgi:hypothetical protein
MDWTFRRATALRLWHQHKVTWVIALMSRLSYREHSLCHREKMKKDHINLPFTDNEWIFSPVKISRIRIHKYSNLFDVNWFLVIPPSAEFSCICFTEKRDFNRLPRCSINRRTIVQLETGKNLKLNIDTRLSWDLQVFFSKLKKYWTKSFIPFLEIKWFILKKLT